MTFDPGVTRPSSPGLVAVYGLTFFWSYVQGGECLALNVKEQKGSVFFFGGHGFYLILPPDLNV